MRCDTEPMTVFSTNFQLQGNHVAMIGLPFLELRIYEIVAVVQVSAYNGTLLVNDWNNCQYTINHKCALGLPCKTIRLKGTANNFNYLDTPL